MPRIKLVLPTKIKFTTTIPIRITDINYGNHVGNDSLVSIIHEARVKWLVANNYTELNVAGASLIMADLAVEYKSESFYGDVLTINIFIGEINTVGFEVFYEITTKRDNQTILIAKAKTGLVCYDYNERKVTAIPSEFGGFLMD